MASLGVDLLAYHQQYAVLQRNESHFEVALHTGLSNHFKAVTLI